jgi:hypothetical protein
VAGPRARRDRARPAHDERDAVDFLVHRVIFVGDVDILGILVQLKKMNCKGFLIDDHVPQVVNDTEWGHRSRAYATGYISTLIRAAKQLG